MPGDAVLTAGSMITCGHGPPPAGAITPVPSTLLTVAEQGVLTLPAGPPLTVSGCPQPASAGTKPCTTVTITPAGAAVLLTVDGVPVLLASTLAATTDGVPPGMSPTAAAIPPAVPMTVTANQILLTAE